MIIIGIAQRDPILQWGRNRSVAEGSASGDYKTVVIMLQWGRNRSVAEV